MDDSKIELLIGLIAELVNEDGAWPEKKRRLLEHVDEATDLIEFASWFDED